MSFSHPTHAITRLLTREELASLNVGDDVYIRRGEPEDGFYIPGTVKEIRIREVVARTTTDEGNVRFGDVVGRSYQLNIRDQFSIDATVNLYDTVEGFDATYPASRGFSSREKAAAAQTAVRLPAEPGTYGAERTTLVPVFGSHVSIPIFIPGMNPEDAKKTVIQALLSALPEGTTLPRAQARLVPNVRADVHHSSGGKVTVAARGVLEAEVPYYAPPAGVSLITAKHRP